MADPKTFAELWDQFWKEWDSFNKEWSDAWKHCTDIIDSALSGVGQFIDDILPGENEAENALDKWNNEIAPKLNEGYSEVYTQVSELVNDLVGSPLDLQLYAETFSSAKADLFKQRGFEEAQAAIAGSWGGDAHKAYVPVATKQNEALRLLGNALDEGGKLTSAAARKILQVWADLIYQFATFYADIIAVLSSATSVENIISFEVPTLLQAVEKIWRKVADVVKVLADFMVAQATTDTVAWVSLAAGSGQLPGNDWPPVPETSSDSVNQPGGWSHAS
ncbi:MAG TPA: hypothetical protein VNQ53_15590 [Nocardioides sp.]|nr:hypothetical protein [Nocardioides sp.]